MRNSVIFALVSLLIPDLLIKAMNLTNVRDALSIVLIILSIYTLIADRFVPKKTKSFLLGKGKKKEVDADIEDAAEGE